MTTESKEGQTELPIQEDIAKKIFRARYPDTPWGISGTVDDTSWRVQEHRCRELAMDILRQVLGECVDWIESNKTKEAWTYRISQIDLSIMRSGGIPPKGSN